jgi:hypothetical protein
MPEQIEALAARLTRGLDSEAARASRIHDFVRDEVAFGFTPQLDAATPEQTLAAGVGHTIPKTTVFVALLRALGLRAYPHFVTIDRELLRGVFPNGLHRLLPWEIPHAYAEVEVAGDWWMVDSYALDAPLWRAAMHRLASEGELIGYGAHGHGTCEWDGVGHAFAQLATCDMLVEDHGAQEDVQGFLRAASGVRDVAIAWRSLFSLATARASATSARHINDHLDRLRAGVPFLASAGLH